MSRPKGYKHSEKTKQKIKKTHQKIKHDWLRGKNRPLFSQEWKNKMSEAKKGKIPLCAGWNKGKKTPEDVKVKMRGKIPWNKGKKLCPSWNKGKGKYPNGRDPIKIKQRLEKYKKLGLTALYLRNCRARRKLAKGSLSSKEWLGLKKEYNFVCPACGRKEPRIKLSIDHIVPLSLGGSSSKENIQPLCIKCNVKKHTKIIKYEIKTRRTVRLPQKRRS